MVENQVMLRKPVNIYAYTLHMHLYGRAMRVEVSRRASMAYSTIGRLPLTRAGAAVAGDQKRQRRARGFAGLRRP